ncbi:sigma-70 family RNA polymerase sigma factor [Streptomyces tendae]|uniref:sigma-70 family RNA polymerase sigma factor n=1 Tax=Streptomyces tendae TaxID=1932 RepID=UPI0037B5626B
MANDTTALNTLLNEIYEQHASDLRPFAVQLTGGDWHRAEDMIQEAIVRAWQQVQKHPRRELRPRPWLKTVIRNLAIDEYRARIIRPHVVYDNDVADTTSVDPSREIFARLLVRDGLRDLSRQHREILECLYIEGHSTLSASRKLGIPQGTVKSRSHHAVRALRTALASRGVTREVVL